MTGLLASGCLRVWNRKELWLNSGHVHSTCNTSIPSPFPPHHAPWPYLLGLLPVWLMVCIEKLPTIKVQYNHLLLSVNNINQNLISAATTQCKIQVLSSNTSRFCLPASQVFIKITQLNCILCCLGQIHSMFIK